MNGELDRSFWAEFSRPRQSWVAWATEIAVALVLAVIVLFLVGCAHVEPQAGFEELECLATVLDLPSEDTLAVLGGCDEVAP